MFPWAFQIFWKENTIYIHSLSIWQYLLYFKSLIACTSSNFSELIYVIVHSTFQATPFFPADKTCTSKKPNLKLISPSIFHL